jgi:hypothetical protein
MLKLSSSLIKRQNSTRNYGNDVKKPHRSMIWKRKTSEGQ